MKFRMCFISREGSPLSGRGRLLLLSFLMFFVELAFIRWIGSNVFFLSYFSNFVLLGSFLGIGIGFLRADSRINIFERAPIILVLVVLFVLTSGVAVECGGSQVIFFGCIQNGLPIWVTLPGIFLTIAATMASIAQGVARSFAEFEPLEAYRLDIAGSLLGIIGFSILSFLSLPPAVWGAIASAAFLALYYPSIKPLQIISLGAMMVLLIHESITPGSSWSPYYKITVVNVRPGVKSLNVNGIPQQWIASTAEHRKIAPIYFLPYRHLHSNPLHNVLIIGAGNGSDAAIALASGAKHVDAVEIDPRIYQIGRQMNPEHPYQQPQVSVHINDGRAFLEQTQNRYDLILFALPDSLALVSGQSSLRLESYLFTIEAISTARKRLNPGGAFGMYNYYREPWLLDRLAHTLEVVYGNRPCIDAMRGKAGSFSLLMVGRETQDVSCASAWKPETKSVPAPISDDRPFLYLRTASIPRLYLVAIASILLTSFLFILGWGGGSLKNLSDYLDLMFMGAAFMLLETKNVVQFALLFGATWFVNALVFFGILLTVLAAVEVAARVRFRRRAPLYIMLLASLALASVVQPDALLLLSIPVRLAAAVGLAFTPIFLANLVFAERFRMVGASTIAFGANLLGAMAGGLLEYTSLIVGYQSLLLLVGLLYAFAFFLSWKHQHRGAQAP